MTKLKKYKSQKQVRQLTFCCWRIYGCLNKFQMPTGKCIKTHQDIHCIYNPDYKRRHPEIITENVNKRQNQNRSTRRHTNKRVKKEDDNNVIANDDDDDEDDDGGGDGDEDDEDEDNDEDDEYEDEEEEEDESDSSSICTEDELSKAQHNYCKTKESFNSSTSSSMENNQCIYNNDIHQNNSTIRNPYIFNTIDPYRRSIEKLDNLILPLNHFIGRLTDSIDREGKKIDHECMESTNLITRLSDITNQHIQLFKKKEAALYTDLTRRLHPY